ncbi:hypothetical protein N0V85_009813 [Neurospora sp. IMI 360204]|nr:hypothetical protein N0V85_009813 [Neurospora sp. IMI 360204]
MHVRVVLDARERARTEEGLKVEQQALREVDEDLKRMTLDEEREKRVVEETGVVEEKEEEEKEKKEENEKGKEEEQIDE